MRRIFARALAMTASRSSLTLVVAAATMMTACAGNVAPVPVAGDAERATVRWADADLDQLNTGRRLYVQKCSGCHALISPRAHSPEAWPAEVNEMAIKINLPDGDRELITRYLVTMSELSGPAGSEPSPRAAEADAPAAGVDPLGEAAVDPEVR